MAQPLAKTDVAETLCLDVMSRNIILESNDALWYASRSLMAIAKGGVDERT